ncbi:MAG: RNA 2',3'-cyclic phosphodiesterase [Candidatus Obscuribacterales bacterium]|nr:RNA 2',3'-cyclic phosphodiesterase [Candidatus Obscuribacterales bacterium]
MAVLVAMSPDLQTKRLFVGTFLSPEQQESLGCLAERKTELETHLECRVRFVKPVKLHLTWLFLGDVEVSKLTEIQAKLQAVAADFHKQRLTYNQVKLWPSDKRARMIVLTPETVPDSVAEMAASIANELRGYVIKPEHRDYRPHITLARLERENFKPHPVQVPEWLVEKIPPIAHQIESIELIQSELGKAGDEYKSLHCVNLRQ